MSGPGQDRHRRRHRRARRQEGRRRHRRGQHLECPDARRRPHQRPRPIVQADVADYWTAYEVNVMSIILLAKHLFPLAAKGASVVTVPAGAVAFPAAMTAGLSGYLVSKLALIKTVEYLAVENPDLNVTAVHPGMVDTAIFRGSGATPESPMVHMDTPQLFAGLCLWVTRPEARFLSGKMVWANWDVEELKGKEEEITSKNLLNYVWNGFPFA
ncbi:oxidoreductase YciK [Apiospora sp. TS-2023a]